MSDAAVIAEMHTVGSLVLGAWYNRNGNIRQEHIIVHIWRCDGVRHRLDNQVRFICGQDSSFRYTTEKNGENKTEISGLIFVLYQCAGGKEGKV